MDNNENNKNDSLTEITKIEKEQFLPKRRNTYQAELCITTPRTHPDQDIIDELEANEKNEENYTTANNDLNSKSVTRNNFSRTRNYTISGSGFMDLKYMDLPQDSTTVGNEDSNLNYSIDDLSRIESITLNNDFKKSGFNNFNLTNETSDSESSSESHDSDSNLINNTDTSNNISNNGGSDGSSHNRKSSFSGKNKEATLKKENSVDDFEGNSNVSGFYISQKSRPLVTMINGTNTNGNIVNQQNNTNEKNLDINLRKYIKPNNNNNSKSLTTSNNIYSLEEKDEEANETNSKLNKATSVDLSMKNKIYLEDQIEFPSLSSLSHIESNNNLNNNNTKVSASVDDFGKKAKEKNAIKEDKCESSDTINELPNEISSRKFSLMRPSNHKHRFRSVSLNDNNLQTKSEFPEYKRSNSDIQSLIENGKTKNASEYSNKSSNDSVNMCRRRKSFIDYLRFNTSSKNEKLHEKLHNMKTHIDKDLSSFFERPKINFLKRISDEHHIINDKLSEMLRGYLPAIYKECFNWELVYSLIEHGASINTLIKNCEETELTGAFIFAVLDTEGNIFGAYLSEIIHKQEGYYGSGECFLWKLEKNGQIECYRSTIENHYYILTHNSFIAFGGGKGNFGLYISSDMLNGHSSSCLTYNNQPLSNKENFECLNIELWGFQF